MSLAPNKIEDLTVISDNSSLIKKYQANLDPSTKYKAFKKAKVMVMATNENEGSGSFIVDKSEEEEEDELVDVDKLLDWSSDDES